MINHFIIIIFFLYVERLNIEYGTILTKMIDGISTAV